MAPAAVVPVKPIRCRLAFFFYNSPLKLDLWLVTYVQPTVKLMIFVDEAGAFFPAISHSPWDGITLADFVMPFFLLIVGVALALTYKVKCGVRGDTGPACNAVGMIDRQVLGIQHLYRPTELVFVTGIHMNKALYTLSYTFITAGAAGILFTGVYLLVRDPKTPFYLNMKKDSVKLNYFIVSVIHKQLKVIGIS
ncbi:hypothetical protein BHM03_00057867 [Ensete ventricosum]|nr:hypothetical protein BHM03_00057867 [Ensete ventricosum]